MRALCHREMGMTCAFVVVVRNGSPACPTFSDSIIYNFCSYGILFGVGSAMVRETSTLMLNQYFKRFREKAEMASSAGIGVGIALFTQIASAGIR